VEVQAWSKLSGPRRGLLSSFLPFLQEPFLLRLLAAWRERARLEEGRVIETDPVDEPNDSTRQLCVCVHAKI